jgi:exodeoxyribonuclease VII large subunit
MRAADGRRVLTVSQTNALVNGLLGEHLGDIWIEGEVSNFRAYPSGHLYFALKDDGSQIQAVCFKGAAARLRFELEDGLLVTAHGRVEVYVPSGKYQVILDTIEPKGLGVLQKAFEQLKRKLEKEGLFAPERKRPLPTLPATVGVVTSPAGAAIHDMLRTLRLHRARVKVILFPAQVQGEGAAAQIAEGIAALSARPDVDVLIVGRGGGSAEDLWPFNEEVVARAIAASRAPVVSGVGHETDFTIADFVADVRAATPTAAAQLVAKGWGELDQRLDDLADSLVEAAQQVTLDKEQSLDELVRHRAFDLMLVRLAELRHAVERGLAAIERSLRVTLAAYAAALAEASGSLGRLSPVLRVLRQKSALEGLSAALDRHLETVVHSRRDRLGRAVAGLDALSPLASLGRGYSICLAGDGRIVSRVGQTAPGERVTIRVSDGRIVTSVESTEREETGGH